MVCCDSRDQVIVAKTQAAPLQGNIEVALSRVYLFKPLGQGEWHFEGLVTRSASTQLHRGTLVRGSSTLKELSNYVIVEEKTLSASSRPSPIIGAIFSVGQLGDAQARLKVDQTHVVVTIQFPQVRENVRGACVVTGAFGQLGLLYSAWLLSFGGTDHIVMMGRSGMTIQQRSLLTAAHAIITSVRVDVANSVHCIAATGRCELGQIGHVAHIAGVLKDEWMVNVSNESIHKVMAPKANGLRWIAQLLSLHPAATSTLFSSIASSLGNYGQASYAAANGFMDGFAERTLQAVSVAWGPWDTGMYASLEQGASRRLPTFSPQESAEVFSLMHRSLCRGTSSAVMKIDRWDGLEGLYLGDSFLTRALVTTTATASASGDQSGSATGKADHNNRWTPEQVDRVVVTVMMEALGVAREEEIGLDTPFSDLGVDSIMTIQVTAQLSKQLGKSFQPTLLFNNPTLGALRKRLASEMVRHPSTSDFAVASSLRQVFPGESRDNVIAVIGTACRFSNAASLVELWEKIFFPGTDAVCACPRERWALRGHGNQYDAGYLEGGTQFDADFFKISPREALLMDPQHRLALECGWDCIESARIDPLSLRGTNTGVYLGIQMGEYAAMLTDEIDIFAATGIAPAAAAGRLAYFLDLHGQAIAIDTACSSSLVALTQGSDAISGAKENASYSICMGVQMLFSPEFFDKFRAAGMLSPDLRCKSFDQSANGYVRAEGCGSVLLSRALTQEGSSINVVAAVTNQDGRTNGL
ncbi:MAG: KR domain-containing protein, partial [Cyanobacteria bacterium]|nr:KR domain-containing protein [Cyanobacteriota bacterium]